MSRIPIATYRLQLRREFDFAAAAAIVPYLRQLGISHLYLSPITAARPGSTHGYDVIDYNALNPELGGEAGFARLSEAARANGLGMIVDFVPNHMAASVDNPWWHDVLRHGQSSRYARHFDIDWRRCEGYRHATVTLPLLDKPSEQSDIKIEHDNLVCNGVRLPLAEGGAGSPTEILRQQHYRLIRWQDAPREINYRRFFDINDLVGVNVEQAFDDMHGLVARLAREGPIDGLRLDHIDGVRDPAAYCERLRRLLVGNGLKQPYLLVEKILEQEEKLRPFPGVHGTTGYEALNFLTRLFIDKQGLEGFHKLWHALCGDASLREQAKRQILDTLFPGSVADLAARLPEGTREELVEYLVNLPVYRTYVDARGPSAEDRATVEQATKSEALRRSLLAPSEFAFRLQQFSGPVMAKSVEDTLFYRDFCLLALNEVGGGPEQKPMDPAQFHRAIAQRQATQPHGLIATATHDTKRGEDARMRLAALSMIVGEWREAMQRFPRHPALSQEHHAMLYQALLGGWPLEGVSASFAARVKEFAIKAVREGKEKSSWTSPNAAYEAELGNFIDRLLLFDIGENFRRAFGTLALHAARLGAACSLAQLALKATLPGVPDFYQGCEGWDLSFVDPDNRRPVDYAQRHSMLSHQEDWTELCGDWRNGVVKIKLTEALLALRKEKAEIFRSGRYMPLDVSDKRLIAFARQHESGSVVVAACCAPASFARGDWFDFSSARFDPPRPGLRPVIAFGALPLAIWA
ncbi:MAG: treY [Alphaproteobacteria bacterium]|nr:treY [Alphaproteobacteria bacterium]